MVSSVPQAIKFLTLLLVVGALIAAQQFFSLPGESAFWRSVQDSFHIPWFFALVFILCWWFRRRSLTARFLLVGSLSLVVALATEYVQNFVPGRSASVPDLLRDLLGGVLAFVFTAALFRPARANRPKRRIGPARILLAIATLLVLAFCTLWYPWQELELSRYRDQLLPQVVDFTDARSNKFLEATDGGLMQIGVASDKWPKYSGKEVLTLTFGDGEYPTLSIKEAMQKWASFDDLVLDIFVVGEEPLPLTVAVQYEGSQGTSAFYESTYGIGANEVRIPRSRFLSDEATALRVRDVLIYTDSASAGRTLLIGAIELQ